MPKRVLTVAAVMLTLILTAIFFQKNPGSAGISGGIAASSPTPTAQGLRDATSASRATSQIATSPALTPSARTLLQQSTAIRTAALHSSQSNDPYIMIAALGGLIYCADMGGEIGVPAQTHAAKSFWLSPNLKNLHVSSIVARTKAVLDARERCDSTNADVVILEQQMRSSMSEKLTAYSQLLTETQQMPGLDFNALSLGSKITLFGGNGTALFSVIDQLTTKLIRPDATDSETFAAVLATQLAACQLGDICDAQSFRKHALCLRWGACAGMNVEEALRALLADRGDLQQIVDRDATRLRKSIQSARK